MEDEFDRLTLVELALRGRWHVAAARAARFPEEVCLKNEDGLNALHLAVVNSPPAHLFTSLLEVDEDYVKEACMTKDNSGMTPLLCAAALFAPLEMFQALVEVCPESVEITDSFGASCLHHVCSRSRRGFSSIRRSLARAEVLLEVEPSLSRRQDDSGSTPLHVLCEEYGEDINTHWLSNEPDVQLGILRFDVGGLWLFFETLLRVVPYSNRGNVLHNILSMPSPPLALVVLACRHSQGIQIEQDDRGNTPLHLAIQRQLLDIANFLIRRFPGCVPCLNNNRESALLLATRTFRSFNPCIRLLITTCPHLIKSVTEDHMLFAELFENLLRIRGDISGLSAVFETLRWRPRMVGEGKTRRESEQMEGQSEGCDVK
eukprot:scaffold2490_cov169-Amphora_coffeaeformis.AAC.16